MKYDNDGSKTLRLFGKITFQFTNGLFSYKGLRCWKDMYIPKSKKIIIIIKLKNNNNIFPEKFAYFILVIL